MIYSQPKINNVACKPCACHNLSCFHSFLIGLFCLKVQKKTSYLAVMKRKCNDPGPNEYIVHWVSSVSIKYESALAEQSIYCAWQATHLQEIYGEKNSLLDDIGQLCDHTIISLMVKGDNPVGTPKGQSTK